MSVMCTRVCDVYKGPSACSTGGRSLYGSARTAANSSKMRLRNARPPDQSLRLCMHAATCRPVIAAPFFSLSVAVFLHFLSLFNFLCLWRQAVMELADVEGDGIGVRGRPYFPMDVTV